MVTSGLHVHHTFSPILTSLIILNFDAEPLKAKGFIPGSLGAMSLPPQQPEALSELQAKLVPLHEVGKLRAVP